MHTFLLLIHIICWIFLVPSTLLLLASAVTPWKDNAMPIGGILFLFGGAGTVVSALILFLTGGF